MEIKSAVPITHMSKLELPGVVERERGESKAVSRVPYIPIRDKVLIKAIFELSPLATIDEKTLRKENPKIAYVVGMGDEVQGLKLGDEVTVSFNANIEPIFFDENDKSMLAAMKKKSDIKLLAGTKPSKITIIEFYVVPFFAINGIYVNP